MQVRVVNQCNDVSRIEKETDGTFKVFYKNKDGESSVKAGIVMFGTGRSPNTKNIGLEVRSPQLTASVLMNIIQQARRLLSESSLHCHGDCIHTSLHMPAALLQSVQCEPCPSRAAQNCLGSGRHLLN